MDRTRSLGALTEGTYDLLVVGGGVTGAGVAREASLRGFRVALVEQGDFASGTSSRSTKLIHGGLRYLKQFDFKLVAEAVQERQMLMQMAPHLVGATRFVFPVYRGDPDSLLALRMGLLVYDLFARLQAAVPHRILGPRALRGYEPGLRDRDMVVKLFAELGPRYKARPGGYTRILKMGFRVGDNAPMALVELVDRPDVSEDTTADAAKAE